VSCWFATVSINPTRDTVIASAARYANRCFWQIVQHRKHMWDHAWNVVFLIKSVRIYRTHCALKIPTILPCVLCAVWPLCIDWRQYKLHELSFVCAWCSVCRLFGKLACYSSSNLWHFSVKLRGNCGIVQNAPAGGWISPPPPKNGRLLCCKDVIRCCWWDRTRLQNSPS